MVQIVFIIACNAAQRVYTRKVGIVIHGEDGEKEEEEKKRKEAQRSTLMLKYVTWSRKVDAKDARGCSFPQAGELNGTLTRIFHSILKSHKPAMTRADEILG